MVFSWPWEISVIVVEKSLNQKRTRATSSGKVPAYCLVNSGGQRETERHREREKLEVNFRTKKILTNSEEKVFYVYKYTALTLLHSQFYK